jgi:hypothetical protein
MRARLVWYCLARLRVPCARLVSAARPRAASRPGEAAEGKAAISLAARSPPPPPSSLSLEARSPSAACVATTPLYAHTHYRRQQTAAAAAAAAAAQQRQRRQQQQGSSSSSSSATARQQATQLTALGKVRGAAAPVRLLFFGSAYFPSRRMPVGVHSLPVANRKGQASGSFCGMRRLLKSKAVELQHLQNGAANPPASARGLLRHVVQVPRASLPSHRAIGIGASFCSRRLGLCPALRGGAAHRASCTSKAVFPVALCRQPRRLLKSACFSCCC